MPDEEFADRLRLLMSRSGISGKELGKSLGHVGGEQVSRWLGGHVVPSRENMEKIAEFFKVPVGWLIQGGESPTGEPLAPPDFPMLRQLIVTHRIRASKPDATPAELEEYRKLIRLGLQHIVTSAPDGGALVTALFKIFVEAPADEGGATGAKKLTPANHNQRH